MSAPRDKPRVRISHSHMDHAGALYPVVNKINRSVPLVVHPDIFARRRILKTRDKGEIQFPDCYVRARLIAAGVDLVESRGPRGIAGDTILVDSVGTTCMLG